MTNEELVNHLVSSNVLKTPAIIKAFEKIDRADFVLPEYAEYPYGDYPLPIGCNQTISQPTTVAFMLELLEPQAEEKILDIGSGSGWTTALLAEITGPKGKVFGMELMPELVKFGQKNLAKYNFPQAEIRQAWEKIGMPQEAPFDKILVSASSQDLPRELVEQLKINGRLVIPILDSVWSIDKISQSKIKKQEFPGFVFVPLKH